MTRFLLILPFIFVFGLTTVNAQSYMHGYGLNYLLLTGDGDVLGNYGIEYNPRYNFLETKDFSLSVTSHVGVNFSGSINSRSGGDFSYFILLPALVGINFGGYATDKSDGLGGFAEAGYAYAISNGANVHGPMLSGGVRFDSRFLNEVGLYYLKPLNVDGVNAIGIRVARFL